MAWEVVRILASTDFTAFFNTLEPKAIITPKAPEMGGFYPKNGARKITVETQSANDVTRLVDQPSSFELDRQPGVLPSA